MHVGTVGLFCRHSQRTLQIRREGTSPRGSSGEGQAAARALSPPGPWEEKGGDTAKQELPAQETTGFRHVPQKMENEVWEEGVGILATLGSIVLVFLLGGGRVYRGCEHGLCDQTNLLFSPDSALNSCMIAGVSVSYCCVTIHPLKFSCLKQHDSVSQQLSLNHQQDVLLFCTGVPHAFGVVCWVG